MNIYIFIVSDVDRLYDGYTVQRDDDRLENGTSQKISLTDPGNENK